MISIPIPPREASSWARELQTAAHRAVGGAADADDLEHLERADA
jgi:hypothetical protein